MPARTCAILLLTGGLLATLTGCSATFSSSASGAGARVPLAPPGVYVSDDVAAGYAVYAATLAASGRWSPDATYGVHWCPVRATAEEQPYRPYVSQGHWATSERAAYGAAPGTPYWSSDDAAPWQEITAHHGWWIDLRDGESEPSRWCWVPGAEETPARVVWRWDDDYVGWAPEPPLWIDDGEEDAALAFEWTFELLGTLLEDSLDGYVLTGDAACGAEQATSWAPPGEPGSAFSKRAPARPVIQGARLALLDRVRAHPVVAGGAMHPATAGASGTGSTKDRRNEHEATGSFVVADRLPTAGVLMTMMPPPALAPVYSGDYGDRGGSGGTRGGPVSGPSGGGSPSWSSPGSSGWSPSRRGIASSYAGARGFSGFRPMGGSSSRSWSSSATHGSSSGHSGSSSASSSGHSAPSRSSSTRMWHR